MSHKIPVIKSEMIPKKLKNWIKKRPILYKYARVVSGIALGLLRGKGAGRKLNFIKNSFSAVIGTGKSFGKPILLTIEPTTFCDQRCTICETGLGILERPKNSMSFEQFKIILDQFDRNLEKIFFYFMGESFLNKDAYKMIRYAADRGIWVSVCTNGNNVNPEKLVNSGICEVNFQISGMTQQIHEIYRRGGKLDKVLSNMEETIRLRNSPNCKTKNMKINAGYILMKHNEHQVDEFVKYCDEVGVDNYSIIGTCLREHSQGKDLLPSDRSYWIYDEAEYKKGKLAPKVRPDNYCEWIYFTATIQVNGDVVPCCRDGQGKYVLGNVFDDNFFDIWNNERYQKLRKRVSTDSNNFELCKLCSGYGAPMMRKEK
jgi:radical SAM protein with 4Fe4S-binding SPASM domain